MARRRRRTVGFRVVALIFLGTLGSACTDRSSPEAMYENYLYRLRNVTDFEGVLPVPESHLSPYPRKRVLSLPVEDLRVAFFTYFDLADCDLMQEVSERNSSLGRVQAVSGRLLYEMRFFQKITACEQKLARSHQHAEKDLRIKIAEIRQVKAANLPKVFWNATFASPEFRKLLDTGTPSLRRGEAIYLADILASLNYLSHLGENLDKSMPGISERAFEQVYFHLQLDKVGGKLLQGLETSRVNLAQARLILDETAKTNRLCPLGKQTTRGEYLLNVFRKYYAGEVQPYVSQLHQLSGGLLIGLQSLLRTQKAQPPNEFLAFYAGMLDPDHAGGVWQQFNQAVKEHTRAWQSVLKQCELMPGAPITP